MCDELRKMTDRNEFQNKNRDIQNLWSGILHWFHKCCQRMKKRKRQTQNVETDTEHSETAENPWIYATRSVVEQILWQKQEYILRSGEEVCRGLNRKQLYRNFRPLVIDTDTPNQAFGEDDDIEQVLHQLCPDLNFLEICTRRPERFVNFTVWLEMEYGLMTVVFSPDEIWKSHANVVLDLERTGQMYMDRLSPSVLYIPFYKRRWNLYKNVSQNAEQPDQNRKKTESDSVVLETQNLDIEVPIGYNVLIVKVDKTLQN